MILVPAAAASLHWPFVVMVLTVAVVIIALEGYEQDFDISNGMQQ